jgi:ketosteroid isomerase-like protein
MSEENVEIVRRVYERFGEGDFRASVDLFDRHIVYLMMRDAPWAEAYVGVEAVAAATRELFDVGRFHSEGRGAHPRRRQRARERPPARRRTDQRRSD